MTLMLSTLASNLVVAECRQEAMSVPIEVEQGRVYADVMVNDAGPFRFMVDTGASGFGRADVRLVDELDLPASGSLGNSDGINTATVDVVRIESLGLGSLVRRNIEVMSRDYNRRVRQEGEFLMGIIGQEFFADRRLTIDYANSEIRSDCGSLSESDDHVIHYGQYFAIPITAGGIPMVGHIDTGSSLQMHLPLSWAERLGIDDLEYVGEGRRAYTVFELYSGAIPGPVEIAGHTLHGVEARFSELADSINIGSGLLSRHNAMLTIDQANALLKLRFDGSATAN